MVERLGEMRSRSRERIEIETKEKETKRSSDENLKEEKKEHLCLLFIFLKALQYSYEFPTRFCNKALQQ